VTVYLVGAGPGDPGLLTRRGAAVLARADVVLHDRLVNPATLALVPSSARLIDVGKDPDPPASGVGDGGVGDGGVEDGGVEGGRAGRQEEIERLLVEHGRASAVVVRLKGGDPFLFGRGGEEVEVLAQAGIPWEVVPGVTSAFGVPAAVGIPVTQRGLAASVTVVTGRVGEPHGTSDPDWESLARVGGTLVILMGMTTRAAIADALMRGGRAADTPVAVIAQGTTASEQVARTTLDGLAHVDLGPPAVIVVGPVAALGAHLSDARTDGPLAGSTVVVTRAAERAGGLVDALEQAGARALELPLTRQVGPADRGVALRAAAAAVHEQRWVVVTSVNAVDHFMGALRDARELAPVQVAAVGPTTADALRRTGVEPDLVPAEHSARGLVDAFPDAVGAGPQRVLFPCADLAPDTIPEGLTKKGWVVHRVEAYRTVPEAAPAPALLARVTAADALTFNAPSSVRAFVSLRTADDAPVTPPALVVCVGATTAAAARAAGLDGVHEARGASAQDIVDELASHLGPGGGDGS
jgi:uroporphyrinogen III methyltransferase / synthase